MATVTITIRDQSDDELIASKSEMMGENVESISLDVHFGSPKDLGELPTPAQQAAMFCIQALSYGADTVVGYDGKTKKDVDEWTIPDFVHHRDEEEDD